MKPSELNPGDVIFVGDPNAQRLTVTLTRVTWDDFGRQWKYSGVTSGGTPTYGWFSARPWVLYRRAKTANK